MTSQPHQFASGHRTRRIAALVLFVIAAAAVGVASARRDLLQSVLSSGPIILGPFRVNSDALDFGPVWAQRDFKLSIPITNITEQPVEVIDVIPSCGCTVADRRAFSVAPGQTTEMKLSVDLTNKSKLDPGRDQMERLFPVGVMLLLKSDSASEIRLNARGIVKDWLFLMPPSVHFPEVWPDAKELPVTRLMAMPRVALSKLSAKCDDGLQVEVGALESRRDAKSGVVEQGFPIEVALKERMATGDHVLSLVLFATKADGEELPSLRVPVKVTVAGDVFMSPAFSHLGSIRCGSEGKSSFQLISRRGLPFRITKVTGPDSPEFRITAQSETAQPATLLSVAYSASEPGERSVPVTIDWERERDASAEVPEKDRSGTMKLRFTYVGLP